MPGGEILVVQPSDPLHKLRKKTPTDPSPYSPAGASVEDETQKANEEQSLVENSKSTESNATTGAEEKIEEKDEDDLDDFFASLE